VQRAGYLRIGPAIDALEAEAEDWVRRSMGIDHALYRVMRIYNHDDALMYEERLRSTPTRTMKETAASMSFPRSKRRCGVHPEDAERECRDWKVRDRELLHRFSKGSYATWIERLRRIQRLSRIRLKQSRDYIEAGQYDEPHCRPCWSHSRA